MPNRKVVPYYRVSTKSQFVTGPGIEAQIRRVHEFANFHNLEVLGPKFSHLDFSGIGFLECGSAGKGLDDLPILGEALQYAHNHDASLIVSTVDRLSRNNELSNYLDNIDTPILTCEEVRRQEQEQGIVPYYCPRPLLKLREQKMTIKYNSMRFRWLVHNSFQEPDNGKELEKAIDFAKRFESKVCVARIIALPPSISFIQAMVRQNLLVCCEYPQGIPLELNLMATFYAAGVIR